MRKLIPVVVLSLIVAGAAGYGVGTLTASSELEAVAAERLSYDEAFETAESSGLSDGRRDGYAKGLKRGRMEGRKAGARRAVSDSEEPIREELAQIEYERQQAQIQANVARSEAIYASCSHLSPGSIAYANCITSQGPTGYQLDDPPASSCPPGYHFDPAGGDSCLPD